jgi:hypothetical protein
MGTKENKDVVRRFIEDVVTGRDVDAADDVLAPGYVNVAYEGVDIAGVKAMHTALSIAGVEFRISDLELVAEGDAVSARFDYGLTLPDGSERTSRVLAYYHLTGAKIDVNDVMMVPRAGRRPRAAHGAADTCLVGRGLYSRCYAQNSSAAYASVSRCHNSTALPSQYSGHS